MKGLSLMIVRRPAVSRPSCWLVRLVHHASQRPRRAAAEPAEAAFRPPAWKQARKEPVVSVRGDRPARSPRRWARSSKPRPGFATAAALAAQRLRRCRRPSGAEANRYGPTLTDDDLGATSPVAPAAQVREHADDRRYLPHPQALVDNDAAAAPTSYQGLSLRAWDSAACRWISALQMLDPRVGTSSFHLALEDCGAKSASDGAGGENGGPDVGIWTEKPNITSSPGLPEALAGCAVPPKPAPAARAGRRRGDQAGANDPRVATVRRRRASPWSSRTRRPRARYGPSSRPRSVPGTSSTDSRRRDRQGDD